MDPERDVLLKLLDVLPDAAVIVDGDARIAAASTAAERLFGHDPGSLIGAPIDVLLPEHAQAAHARHVADFFADPTRRVMRGVLEVVGRRRDGSEVPVEISLSPAALAGRLLAVAAIRDVSAQRARLREAARGADHLRTLMTLARAGAWELDPIGGVLTCSPELTRLMGRPQPPTTVAELVAVVHPDDRPALAAMVELLVRTGQPDDLLIRVQTADGGWRWFRCRETVERGDDGRTRRIVGVAMDVTEREEAGERLRRSEANLRAVVDGAPDAIVIHVDGRITACNRAAAALLGVATPAALEGAEVRRFVDPAGGTAAWATPHAEARLVSKDGIARVIQIHSVEIARDDRAEVLSIVRDVTAQHEATDQQRLTDRMVSLGLLAASVGHEINNPLTAVIANLDVVLGHDTRWAPELESALRDAREAAERVRAIARDLKVFTRVDDARRGPVDVHRVIESSLRLAHAELRHRAHVIVDQGDVPEVLATEGHLGQVLLALLVHAAHAIPAGDVDHHQVRVSTRRTAPGEVAIEVADTGVGIAPDLVPRLFEPGTRDRPGDGVSLGLAQCARIIAELGGEISCTSELGKGTRFRVTLPVVMAAVADGSDGAGADSYRGAAPPAAPPAPRSRPRVLIVDDEPMIGAVVQRLLAEDYDVTVATSGAAALTAILARGFDLILCDLMMPQMTGMDLHAELTRTVPDQADRMIFLTGGVFTAAMRAFVAAPSRICIDKPFDLDTLRAVVAERLAGSR